MPARALSVRMLVALVAAYAFLAQGIAWAALPVQAPSPAFLVLCSGRVLPGEVLHGDAVPKGAPHDARCLAVCLAAHRLPVAGTAGGNWQPSLRLFVVAPPLMGRGTPADETAANTRPPSTGPPSIA